VSLVNGLPLKPELTIACRIHPLKSFKDAVENRDFAVSAEIFLRPGTSADSICEQAELLRDHVDAILLTDNQFGQLHMSTLVAASILINAGVDPIVQLTSRNRNRIALISDLIGAAALGVTSLLLVRGERAPEEFDPRPKPVLDVNAAELIRVASTVNQDPRMKHFPDFFIGGVVTPHRPRKRWKGKMLTEKIDAGASYLQTNICMDMDILKSFMKQLVDNGIIRRTNIIGSTAILGSAEDARWLRDNRNNVSIPNSIVDRLEQASDPRQEGIDICTEILQTMSDIPGIAGASIMAARDLGTIPEAIDAAGLPQ
jgi:methylenetetrahydrofolate reductase (NADPH)